MKKPAKMKRKNGKPVVDVITVEKQHDSVEWSVDEDTEFTLSFPSENDVFLPGPRRSTGHILERQINPNFPRGQHRNFRYGIKLDRTNEEVESDSPPEMIIE